MNAAIKLAKEAENRKSEIEKLRNIPKDIIATAKAIGLVKLWAAQSYGGAQLSIAETMTLLQSMAFHNGSLAWVVAVTNCSSLLSGYLPESIAAPLFAREEAMVGGFAGPAGVAKKITGGIQITGQWSWGSGIDHCTHIIGGARLFDGDDMKGTILAFFLPQEIIMDDNWYVTGLTGTHSIDYSCHEVFIPDGRWSFFPLTTPILKTPLYRFSSLGALSLSIAVIGLGLAERAVLEIQTILKRKTSLGQHKPQSKSPLAQEVMGRIAANYEAAFHLFYGTIAKAEQEAQDATSTTHMKADVRLAACHSAQLAVKVVQEAYRLAGGSAIWKSGKLEELHRDIHVVSQHGMVSESNYRTSGSVKLGNEVPEFLL